MIFTQLILAHLLGASILQPNSRVSDKEKKNGESVYLYIHILLHSILAFVFLWDVNLWWIALIIGVSYFIIDLAKLQFQNPKTKKSWVFMGQIAHVLVIITLSFFYFPYFKIDDLVNPVNLKLVTAIVFLTIPCSILIKTVISIWTPVTLDHSKIKTESLVNAGKYIGILERLLFFYIHYRQSLGRSWFYDRCKICF